MEPWCQKPQALQQADLPADLPEEKLNAVSPWFPGTLTLASPPTAAPWPSLSFHYRPAKQASRKATYILCVCWSKSPVHLAEPSKEAYPTDI